MGLEFGRTVSPMAHYYRVEGRAAEIARSLGSPVGGPEHMFLAMIHDGGWPMTVMSPLVDLTQAEAAVPRIEGQELDAPLRRALAEALPGNTTFWLGTEDERAWVCVIGPGDSSDPALTREVLNAALASLNRPALGG